MGDLDHANNTNLLQWKKNTELCLILEFFLKKLLENLCRYIPLAAPIATDSLCLNSSFVVEPFPVSIQQNNHHFLSDECKPLSLEIRTVQMATHAAIR